MPFEVAIQGPGPAPREPEAHISWPGPEETGKKQRIRLTGDLGDLARGRRVRVTIEGVVTGYADQRYGGSVDLKTRSVHIESLGEGPDEDMGRPMTEIVGEMQDEL